MEVVVFLPRKSEKSVKPMIWGPSWGDYPLPPNRGGVGGTIPPSEPLESVFPPPKGCPRVGCLTDQLASENPGGSPDPTVACPPRGGSPDGTPILGGRGVVLLVSLLVNLLVSLVDLPAII